MKLREKLSHWPVNCKVVVLVVVIGVLVIIDCVVAERLAGKYFPGEAEAAFLISFLMLPICLLVGWLILRRFGLWPQTQKRAQENKRV